MRLLVVNAGSSSLKLSLLDGDDRVAHHTVEGWDGEDTDELIRFVDAPDAPPDAVAHRVVHGGERFTEAVLLDDDVLDALRDLTQLAPLHQPRSLAGVTAAREVLPDVAHVACFDTAFHTTLSAAARTYALPVEWRQLGVRRYGFHGLSHAWAARRAAALVGRPLEHLRVVVAHLGSGASLCAVDGGRSVDTTMGFTPLEGVVMATRSGSIDPAIPLWLQHTAGLTPGEVLEGLEQESGLAGLSDGFAPDGDMRTLRLAAARGSSSARLALDVLGWSVRKGIGSMAAALDGVDVVVFTGGVGEHDTDLRAEVCEGLSFLGVRLDPDANAAARSDAVVSSDGAPVSVVVVTAAEDRQIAREAGSLLAAGGE